MTAEEVRSAMHCSVREIRDNSRQVLVNAVIGEVGTGRTPAHWIR